MSPELSWLVIVGYLAIWIGAVLAANYRIDQIEQRYRDQRDQQRRELALAALRFDAYTRDLTPRQVATFVVLTERQERIH